MRRGRVSGDAVFLIGGALLCVALIVGIVWGVRYLVRTSGTREAEIEVPATTPTPAGSESSGTVPPSHEALRERAIEVPADPPAEVAENASPAPSAQPVPVETPATPGALALSNAPEPKRLVAVRSDEAAAPSGLQPLQRSDNLLTNPVF